MAKFAKRLLWLLAITALAIAAGQIVLVMAAPVQEAAQQSAENVNYIIVGETVPLSALDVSEMVGDLSLEIAGTPEEFSDEEREIYEGLAQGFYEMREKIEISSTLENDEMEKILRRAYEAPEFFWVAGIKWTHTKNESGMTEYAVIPEYMMSHEERDQAQLAVDLAVKEILNKANTPEGIAEEAVKWLSLHTEYDRDEKTQTSRMRAGLAGAFADGKIVCSGYSRAVAYCLLRAGYSAAYCVGTTADGTLHAWNAYEDSTGCIVYLDATYACAGKLSSGQSFVITSYLTLDENALSQRTLDREEWYSPAENNA